MQYKICKENITAHEVIGLNAEVVQSEDVNKKGLEGKIVDETKETLRIEVENGEEKILPKKEVSLRLKLLNGEKIEVNGKELIGKPEDRIKESWRKAHGRM